MSTELVKKFLDDQKDGVVIEKIMENEVTPEIENQRSEVILKVLEIVDRYGLDPWNIDLQNFTSIFLDEVNEYFRNFPVAGKIVYFAWINIRNKSELLLPKEEEPIEPEGLLDDGSITETQDNFTPEVSMGYIPSGKRNVTVDDIVEAIRNTPLNILRTTVRKAKNFIFQENSHPEDFQVIIGEIWKRMIEVRKDHFTMESISKKSLDDFINLFQSSLFLSFYGRIELNQEVPYGNIWIKVLRKSDTSSPIPELKLEEDEFAV